MSRFDLLNDWWLITFCVVCAHRWKRFHQRRILKCPPHSRTTTQNLSYATFNSVTDTHKNVKITKRTVTVWFFPASPSLSSVVFTRRLFGCLRRLSRDAQCLKSELGKKLDYWHINSWIEFVHALFSLVWLALPSSGPTELAVMSEARGRGRAFKSVSVTGCECHMSSRAVWHLRFPSQTLTLRSNWS